MEPFIEFFRSVPDSLLATLLASALVVALALLFSGRIAGFAAALLERTPLFRLAAARLKLKDHAGLIHAFSTLVRIFVVVSALAAGWQILGTHPSIARFIAGTFAALGRFMALSAVEFVMNIVLVAVESVVLLRVAGWLKTMFGRLERRVRSEEGCRLKGFSIQRVQVFTASRLTAFLLVLSRYVRYALNALLLFIYLTALFSIFPQTRGTVQSALSSFFVSVEHAWSGFVGYLPSLFILVLVVFATRYGLRLIRFIFGEVEKGTITIARFKAEWAIPTYQLVRFLVIALALVLAFPYLPGSSSPAFQGISVFIGLLFSLGSTSVVANVVSGVVLTYTGAFRLGDRVRIADTVGDVIEKGLLVTRIRTIKNEDITIPNGMVMGSHIVNYNGGSHAGGLILHATVTLGYELDWRHVHETLVLAARKTDGILAEPSPFVLQTALDDFYVHYEINAHTDRPHEMASIYSGLYQNIQDCCREAGIEILSPHYGALRDGNASTLPEEHLPKGYREPRFGVRTEGAPGVKE